MDDLYHPECRFYLARQVGPMAVELVDGCHSDHAGVARTAKLIDRILGDRGSWLMVELHELPAIYAEVDEEAAAACREMIDS